MFLSKVMTTHWGGALSDSEHPKRLKAWQASAPVAIGSIALASRGVLASSLDILSSVSIITGLLFSLLAFLVQLRAQMRVRHDSRTRNAINVDYAFYSSVYACTVGFTLVVAILLQKLFAALVGRHSLAHLLTDWLIYALFAHFVLTMWQCLRRLWRLYQTEGLNQP